MKRRLTFAIIMLFGASLALAQTGGDKNKPAPPGVQAADNTKPNAKATPRNGKKGHKSGKKGKKSSGGTTTPPPK
jgi:hypothetical protein